MNLADQPYWSAADDAELDLLTLELAVPCWKHMQRCEVCVLEGGCSELRAALERGLEAVLDWRRRRALESRAIWLRAREAA